jgi:hypothetical protein|tara:strand:- start:404 stop:700 length:297 start_codon:yes stop_codon:yes gene_type:complete
MADYESGPKIDFAVFKNSYAKNDRHPAEVGKIEFSREFLRAMVDRAKTGTMPVLRVAMWNRTSKTGTPYRNFRLELERETSEKKQEDLAEEEDDGLPF